MEFQSLDDFQGARASEQRATAGPAPGDARASCADAMTERLAGELWHAGADRRSVRLFLDVRGLDGQPPVSLRRTGVPISAERVRQLTRDVETRYVPMALRSGRAEMAELRQDVEAVLGRLARLAPGADESITKALAADGFPVRSACSLVRLADVLGVPHSLRLTTWTFRSKRIEDGSRLSVAGDPMLRATVHAVVLADSPEVFSGLMNLARKVSRGAGVIGASRLATEFSMENAIAVTAQEAAAFLQPFAVHLGRHDGDEWYAFLNSANDFVAKSVARAKLFGVASLEQLLAFHRRYNRSLYADGDGFPSEALTALLELAGLDIAGDAVSLRGANVATSGGHAVSAIQAKMVGIFREAVAALPGRKGLTSAEFVKAMTDAGIRESTAHVYLSAKGLFCKKGETWRLAEVETAEAQAA